MVSATLVADDGSACQEGRVKNKEKQRKTKTPMLWF
jgi:predicted nucleic acid-binding Zn ribbon protein